MLYSLENAVLNSDVISMNVVRYLANLSPVLSMKLKKIKQYFKYQKFSISFRLVLVAFTVPKKRILMIGLLTNRIIDNYMEQRIINLLRERNW